MDRQNHDYAAAAAIAFAQQQQQQQQQQQAANIQQQQFGFHPQHQQFPPAVQTPPFLAPHSLQQYPYHRPMQQQPPQLHTHAAPHPHLLHHHHPQAQNPVGFPPHLPPHLAPSTFPGPYDSGPPPVPPPSDPELQKRINKLVEYAAKNGPEFEAMICEKQQDNPAYSFLFGGEGHNYYRYKLWLSTRPPGPGAPFNAPFPSSSMPMMHPSNPMITPSPLNTPPRNASAPAAAAASASMAGAPQIHQPQFPPFFEQQHHQHSQPFAGHVRPDYDSSGRSFKGLSGPLPSDVAMELSNVLSSLTGTKESIKSAKIWFMQRSPFAPAMAEALAERFFALDDSERQLHIIYLANDILFDSLQRRINPHDLDNEALAFRPVLGSMLARVYRNPKSREDNQSRLQKILQFWASKEVYDRDTIRALETEMIGGLQAEHIPRSLMDLSGAASGDPSTMAGLPHTNQGANWQFDKQGALPSLLDQELHDKSSIPAMALSLNQQLLPNSATPNAFLGSLHVPSAVQPENQLAAAHLVPPTAANIGENVPPYPFFPPGLIPGMVRKMQIGSGVPYSPMSPLDIPIVIPPSTVSPSEVLERVSKFFREVGEVNPSEGPMNPTDGTDEMDDYEREAPVRKGGACIPPPPNLQVDPETGSYADGSVDWKQGSGGSGRLGLGATADPNKVSQYDDVYSSYRKQRSTNYHSSMTTRAAAVTR